jgi:hypothetical protein
MPQSRVCNGPGRHSERGNHNVPQPKHLIATVIELLSSSEYVQTIKQFADRGVFLPISAADAINPALQHAKTQLFRPFLFRQWWRLSVVGFLAGELGSGGCNGSLRIPATTHGHGGSNQFFGWSWPWHLGQHPALLAGLITLVIVVAVGLVVLFTYVNSVMRFILFDSIVTKECHIREGWARRRREGRRLFVWQILLSLLSLASVTVLIGIPVALAWADGWFKNPGEHVGRLVLGGLVLFLVLMTLVVSFAVAHVMTKDFVVPQMALEEISAFEGWNRLWLWLKAEKGAYAGYIGMKIVLAIAASMAVTIISLIAILILLIPVGGLGAFIALGAKAAGMSWSVYTITLAVAAAGVILAILLFVVSLISVPTVVFFPAYSIYFFASRYPALASLIWPAPEAPPLPPAPAPVV